MGPHRYTLLLRQRDCPFHDQGITGMVPTGDVGRRYVLNNLFIQTQFIGAKAFSHITIDIHFHFSVFLSRLFSTIFVQKERNVKRFVGWGDITEEGQRTQREGADG